MEIERKFLIPSLPNLECTRIAEIYQGYVSTDPEVRIRSWTEVTGENAGHTDYKLTVKGNGDLAREEVETYITEDFFNALKRFIRKSLIFKKYFIYNYDGHKIECSIVDPVLDSTFIYGEVEFQTEDEANAFEWPFPDAIDITYRPECKMKNYWIRTRG